MNEFVQLDYALCNVYNVLCISIDSQIPKTNIPAFFQMDFVKPKSIQCLFSLHALMDIVSN